MTASYIFVGAASYLATVSFPRTKVSISSLKKFICSLQVLISSLTISVDFPLLILLSLTSIKKKFRMFLHIYSSSFIRYSAPPGRLLAHTSYTNRLTTIVKPQCNAQEVSRGQVVNDYTLRFLSVSEYKDTPQTTNINTTSAFIYNAIRNKFIIQAFARIQRKTPTLTQLQPANQTLISTRKPGQGRETPLV